MWSAARRRRCKPRRDSVPAAPDCDDCARLEPVLRFSLIQPAASDYSDFRDAQHPRDINGNEKIKDRRNNNGNRMKGHREDLIPLTLLRI